jgi:hypothetical protein
MYYGTPPIITDGLVLNLDAQSPQSIPLDPTVNLFNLTENIPTFPWQSNNGTRVTSSMAAPFGPGSASLYSATAGFCNIFQERTLYQGTYNLSWYIKYINQRYYSLILEGTSGGRVTFDILNGTVVAGSLAGSGTSPVIEPAPNGYYRISLSLNITTSSIAFARPLLWTGVYNGNSFSGSQAYVWGPQLSRTSYATPYVSSSSTVLGARTSWQDLSGNNNTATLLSSSISGSIPVFPAANNRVLQFDGTSSYASIPNSSNLVFGNGDFTVGIWIKTPIFSVGEGSPSQWGPIISKGCTTSAPAGTWWFAQSGILNNRLAFNASSTAGGTFVCYLETPPSLVDGWHNVVFTRFGSTGTLYTDGVRSSIDTTTDSDLFSTAPIYLGSTSPTPQKKTGMGLSQVQIYNRALSQSEITQNYNALKSRFGLQ